MHPFILRILRILKNLFVILLIIAGTSLLAGTILFLVYKNSIQQAIIHEINRNLTAEVRTGKIKISLLAHFPMISVSLKDVRITGPLGRSNNTDLLQADDCSLRFNFMDALHKKYTLEVFKLADASVNLIIFEDDSDNFHLWKSPTASDTGRFAVEIREVILQKVDLTWQNQGTGDTYAIRSVDSKAKGNFSDDTYDLTVRGNFVARLIQISHKTYVQDRELDASARLFVNNNDASFRIMEGMIKTGLLTINLSGNMDFKGEQAADVTIHMEEAPLEEYLSLIPDEYLAWKNNISVEGNASVTIALKGQMGENRMPDLRMDFRLARGTMSFEKPNIRLDQILAEGSYSLRSGKGNKDELRIDRLMASLGDSRVEGFVRLTDLSHPVASLTAGLNLGLRDLADLLPIKKPEDIEGRLEVKVEMKGPLNSLDQIDAHDFFNWKIQGDANLDADRLVIEQNPVKYHDIRGSFHFDNQLLTVNELSGKTENSDFQIRGIVANYLNRILSGDDILKMDLSVTCNQLDINELKRKDPVVSHSEYHFKLPSNLIINADVAIDQFLLDDFSASGMQAKLILRDQRVTLNDLTFSSMQGNITADVDLSPVNDQTFLFRCNARLKHVNLQQLFHDFRNFNQTSLTDQHLRGYVDADLFYASKLSGNLATDVSSIYTLGQVTVNSGELIGYTPLYQLAGFLEMEDLKHIRFSELKNLIEIRDGTIVIPQMEIKSNTLDLTLNGTHTFHNAIDYHLSLLLSELLSRKARPDTQREFGVVEDDGLGRTRLYIAIKGTTDHPEISYDRPALKGKLAKDLQKERQVLRAALQEEFNISTRDSVKTDNVINREQVHFRIGWEEEEQDSVPRNINSSKIKGSKFNIQWEDDDTLIFRPAG